MCVNEITALFYNCFPSLFELIWMAHLEALTQEIGEFEEFVDNLSTFQLYYLLWNKELFSNIYSG
jgi:uncharacterized protein Yka (UPF0111/DUF47 family)